MISSEERRQQVAALYRDNPNIKVKKASELLGINEKTLTRYRKELGLSKKRSKVTDEIRHRVFYLSVVEKIKNVEIARMTNLSTFTIHSILKQCSKPVYKPVQREQFLSPASSPINQMLMQQWRRGFHIDSAVHENQQ